MVSAPGFWSRPGPSSAAKTVVGVVSAAPTTAMLARTAGVRRLSRILEELDMWITLHCVNQGLLCPPSLWQFVSSLVNSFPKLSLGFGADGLCVGEVRITGHWHIMLSRSG